MISRNEPTIDGPEGFRRAFGVSRETIQRLEDYAAILQHWRTSTNLVSKSTVGAIWSRHFADSAQLLDLAPSAKTWLDLGAGAGFPGLVIAILLAGGRGGLVHLVERSAKKCAFLREVARSTDAPVEIHGTRIEFLVDERRFESVEVVTARALAPLGKLLGYVHPFMTRDTIGLFPKGRDVEQEIEDARRLWRFDVRLEPSRSDPGGRIAIISSLEPIQEG